MRWPFRRFKNSIIRKTAMEPYMRYTKSHMTGRSMCVFIKEITAIFDRKQLRNAAVHQDVQTEMRQRGFQKSLRILHLKINLCKSADMAGNKPANI